jgi:hypothetical protein
MAINNKRISVAELDFDAIKSNLKNFLKGQTEFQDYDFEGSAMSVLLDILAYNTHYNGIYTNLAANEIFLDSASKRVNVVSLAKMLGYTPKSALCAKAIVDVTIISPTSQPPVVTLPANQPFNTLIDNKTYTFYNRSGITVALNSQGNYTFSNVELVEGTPLTYRYNVTEGQRFIIPNPNVDLSTLSVKVQETATSDTFDVYTRVEDLLVASETSKIYFIKEVDNNLFEVYFGNDIIGRRLDNGNVITLEYYVSSLEEPNGAFNFSYNGATLLSSNLSVVTKEIASGGSLPEDISSIKFNAPRLYAAQNRAVTAEDYRGLVESIFPEAETIMVWGGEDNIPKIYGKAYICVKPNNALKLTNIQKDFIISALQNKNVVSITPEIVDPEYLNVNLETTVYYNDRLTSKSLSQIQTLVKDVIFDYDETELQKFDSILRFSKLSTVIDDSDPSISNNTSRLTITRTVEPKFNINAQYIINIVNPISQGGNKLGEVFKSTGFYIPTSTQIYYLDDDEQGNIRLYYFDANFNKVILNPTIGTIDYAKGLITIKNLNISALADPLFEFTFVPASYDVVSALNQIVQISRENLTVNVVADRTTSGDIEAGYNYTFTPIR